MYIWQNIRVHETILGRAIVEGNYVYLAEHCIGRRCRLGGTSEVEVAAASHIWQLVVELLLTGLFIFNIIIIIIIVIIMPLISGSWWWNYPELLTGLFIFNIIISIIITIITSIIIFKPSPSS